MLFLCLPYSLIPYGQFRCFDQFANERKAVWGFFCMEIGCCLCVCTVSPKDLMIMTKTETVMAQSVVLLHA